jgi:hypothetical protein
MAQVLKAIKNHDIANMPCSAIRSKDMVEFLQSLTAEPQTVGNYASHLGAICQSARKVDPLSASNVAPLSAFNVDDQHLDRPTLAGVAEGEPGAGDGALRP